ncbi:MAG: hypothetical protein H6553_05055 [Chitinophagales bacterium]|nr:hypothetical protein [Chitinophagales bacterium]
MKKSTLLILGTIFFLWSTGKPPKKKTDTWIEPKTVVGNWIWVKTECCGTQKGITTPQTFGDEIALTINPDMSFKETANKYKVPRVGSVKLGKKTALNEADVNTIQFNDERPAYYSFSTKGDTLILSWEHLGLQKEYYAKK